jgi:hypothetical protein
MNGVAPYIRHMILCEDVRADRTNPMRINLYGLIHTIRPQPLAYPFRVSFCVFLWLTGGRGIGRGQIRFESDSSGLWVYIGHEHSFRSDPDPLQVSSVVFRVSGCSLPQRGLYWVQFWYNGRMLEAQPLYVR